MHAVRALGARLTSRQQLAAGGILAVLVLQFGLPERTPAGIVLLGLVLGGLNAMLAAGIVIVHRTSRVVNFAHGDIGAVGGVLAVQLTLVWGWPYYVSLVVGVLTAGVIGGLTEVLVVRRFKKAPRLLLMVATIGVAQLLAFVGLLIPQLFGSRINDTSLRTPLSDIKVTIEPVVFSGDHLIIVFVAVAAGIGLQLFFNRTRYGVATRAAAENAERAELVGIPIKRLSVLMWTTAGLLAGTASILQSPVTGIANGQALGPSLLLRGLAAAVIARMVSVNVAIGAALALSVAEQAIFWSYPTAGLTDAFLLVVILAALLIQRRVAARVDPEDASSWKAINEARPVPRELRRLPEVRIGRGVLLAVTAIVALGLPQVLSVSRQSLASVTLIFAMVGISLVALSGWSGLVSLGHFAFVGIGAAAAGTVSVEFGGDALLAVGAGTVAGALASLAIGLPAIRLRGFFLAVATLAFAVATHRYFLRLDWMFPEGVIDRPVLFGRWDLEDERTYYYVCLAVLAVVTLIVASVRKGRIGRTIVGVRDNTRAAQAFGIDATRAKLQSFVLSGAIAGLAGAMLVFHQHRMQVDQYTPAESLQVLAMTLIGGLGSIPGAIIGAVYVKGAQYFLPNPWSFLATGLGMLILLIVLPQGLASGLVQLRDRALRAVAARRGIVVSSLLADVRVAETTTIDLTDAAPALETATDIDLREPTGTTEEVPA